MELQHVNVKLYLDAGEAVLEPVIPVFHRWIQERVFEELLLDVADYRHVPAGPGVLLIGHQANYAVDNTGGRLGVLYNRKAPLEGSQQDRLVQAARAALAACRKLETEPSLAGRLRFNGREIEIFVNDRLLAPNTPATRAAFVPELQAFCAKSLGGAAYSAAYEEDPRKRFGVRLILAQPVSTETLLGQLSG